MAKKPSFDMAKVKEYLLQKGERLGLWATVGLTLLLLILSFVGLTTKPPASAGAATWGEAFTKAAQTAKIKMDTSKPEVVPEKKLLDTSKNLIPVPLTFAQLFDPATIKDDKRRNPTIYPVSTQLDDAVRDIQMDYLLAPALAYQVNFDSQKIYLANNEPVRYLEPTRMVVVTAAFPYQEQLKIFQQALQYESLRNLLASKDTPQFLGLNIARVEIGPDGKDSNPQTLYFYDTEKNKTVVHPPLDLFFRRMLINQNNPSPLGPNMATPIPFLGTVNPEAGGQYPPLKLTGFEQAPTEEDPIKPNKTMPINPGGFFNKPTPMNPKGVVDSGPNPTPEFWRKLADRDLVERLKGNYNVFDPFARPLAKTEEKGNPNTPNKFTQPMPPMFKAFQPNVPNAATTNPDENTSKLLVRFIDVDVRVGKTYKYWIQVRVANPNFESKDVAAQEMAAIKELYSQPVSTPTITIPGEMFFYALDQPVNLLVSDPKKVKGGNDTGQVSDVAATVQIHRWLARPKDLQGEDHAIGDWVVAERLLIHRGEPLGRKSVMVEVPEWNFKQGKFVLGSSIPKHKPASAIPIDFLDENQAPPLLVDFQGGHHSNYKTQKSKIASDDAALELLVLDSDGKLISLNSHVDSVDPQRIEHLQRWSRRVRSLHNSGAGGSNPNIKNRPPAGPGVR